MTDAVRARNEDADTVDGIAFIGRRSIDTPAGEYPRAQLYISSGQSLVAFLDTLLISTFPEDDVGILIETNDIGSPTDPSTNKDTGGFPSNVDLNGDSVVSQPTGESLRFTLPSKSVFRLPFNRPFRINAGYGLTVFARTAGTLLDVVFEWREFPT